MPLLISRSRAPPATRPSPRRWRQCALAGRPDDAAVAVGASTIAVTPLRPLARLVSTTSARSVCGAAAARRRKQMTVPAAPAEAVRPVAARGPCRAGAPGRKSEAQPFRARGLHRIGLMAHDNHRGAFDRLAPSKDVVDQRHAGHAMQHLGDPPIHRVPLPAARTTIWVSGYSGTCTVRFLIIPANDLGAGSGNRPQ